MSKNESMISVSFLSAFVQLIKQTNSFYDLCKSLNYCLNNESLFVIFTGTVLNNYFNRNRPNEYCILIKPVILIS